MCTSRFYLAVAVVGLGAKRRAGPLELVAAAAWVAAILKESCKLTFAAQLRL